MLAPRAALRDVADLGPFFAVSADPAEGAEPTWTPWREFYADPCAMVARIDVVARALGTGDRRVAASIALQGLAARLVSPILAAAAVHGVVPTWSPDSLHWRPAVSGPWPMWESHVDTPVVGTLVTGAPVAGTRVADTPGTGRDDAEVARAVARALVEPHLAALVQVTRAAESVPERVLRGNVASAVAATGALIARARPGAAGRDSVIVSGLLRTPLLSGSGGFEAGWSFRRRSCCLYYRVPGSGMCGDCVLAPVPGRS